jgi:hypothetical protein
MTMTETIHYRVIEILTNDFGAHNHGHLSKVDETTKWSGTDLEELSLTYPPSNIFGADPLGHSEIEDGLIRYDYRFEQQSEDGTWEKIDDPRRRITPVTSLELEIDAENRRLFPGDYITDDEEGEYDEYGPYCCDNCRDRGCEECDPSPDCSNCGDRGCEQCDPEAYPPQATCSDCGCWFDADSLTSEGLCSRCEADRLEWAKPRCFDCGKVHKDTSLSSDDLCADCTDYYSREYDDWQAQLSERWYHRLIKRLLHRS